VSDQLPLIDMKAQILPTQPPKRAEVFIVMAWNSSLHYWDIPSAASLVVYIGREAAETAASRLDGIWTHRTILRAVLGETA
jgi:hypothetical protein